VAERASANIGPAHAEWSVLYAGLLLPIVG
jgi:hypothetical protein